MEAMVDNRLRIEDEDEDDEEEDGGGFSSKPRVSVERNRRSLKLSFSFIADGLSPKSKSLYTKLPSQPLNLSVLKLDGSSFGNSLFFFYGFVWLPRKSMSVENVLFLVSKFGINSQQLRIKLMDCEVF